MSEHSILPPSSAGVTVHCSGSVLLRVTYPDDGNSEAAMEGDAAHELAAMMVNSLKRAKAEYPAFEVTVGTLASNGVLITEEIYEGAQLYADAIGFEMRSRGVFNPYVEHRITAKRIHELSFGTLDCALFDSKQMHLLIFDFKFGYKSVSEYENWQLINYAQGMLEELGIDGLSDQVLKVSLIVVQPRSYHSTGPIRRWDIRARDLRPYVNRLHAQSHAALGNNVEFVTGPHCYRCNGLHACSAARSAGLKLFEVGTRVSPTNLTPSEMGTQLLIVSRAIEQLEFLKTAYEEQITAVLKRGELVPNYAMVPKNGRRRWNKPDEQIIALGQALEIELSVQKLITPTQAKAKGIDESVLAVFSETPSKGVSLSLIDHNKAKRIFSNG